MAQIIKHRRGSIDSVKNSTSRKGELIMATGSVGNLNGPFVFIGTDEGSGLYSPASKLYAGNSAPTLTAATYGTTLDGTPFYADSDKSLYILNNSNVGNSKIDLTGNIEGNTISGVTINNLQSTNVTASFVSGAFIGDASGLFNIPATGVTGLNLSKIYSGSVQVSTDSVTGEITLSGGTVNILNETNIVDNNLNVNEIHGYNNGYVNIYSTDYTQLNYDDSHYIWLQNDGVWVESNGQNITLKSLNGSIQINSDDSDEGNVYIGHGGNSLYVSGNTYFTSTVYIDNDASIYHDNALYIQDDTNGVVISSTNYAELTSGNAWIWVENSSATVEGDTVDIYSNDGPLYLTNNTTSGSLEIKSRNGGDIYINNELDNNVGNVHILSGQDNKMFVHGDTTFDNNVYVSDLTDTRLVLVGADGLLKDNSDLVFDGSKLQIGQGTFEVDSSTGNIRTSGSIVMKGNITIGDNLTGDTINLNAEISSSLVPSGSNLFNLGSSTNYWHDLFVSGTAYIQTLNLGSIELNSITLPGDLTVSGTTQFSGSVSISGLTQDRVVYVGTDGLLIDNSDFIYNSSTGYLSAPIINATNDGNGTNFLVGNDMWIGDVNQSNTMMFKGASDDTQMKVLLNNNSSNNYLEANYGDVYLNSNQQLYLRSSNNGINLESYDGSIDLNSDSGNNVRMYGHTYINNHNLYVNRVWDNSDTSNYVELYGWNTDDGYWWEGGNGQDTTILNSMNGANVNILQRNNGKVNIDASTVNLNTSNGFNVTGSMIVSDASGVFNSSLVANNSNLTLNNGSNLEIQDNGTLTVDGDGNFHSDIYVSGTTRSDNYRGLTNSDNALHLNQNGTFSTAKVELVSVGDLSLFAEGNNGSGIHLTGSVYSDNNITINNNNYLYTSYVYGYDNGALNLGSYGDVNIYSDNSRNVDIYVSNDESGTNHLWVQHEGVGFQTYDITSDNNHTVYLDNTGSLKLTNVDVQISGSLGVDGNTRYNNDLTVGGDMYVSGNFTVLGTGSLISLTGSQVDFGTNKILLNTYAPFERFAGIDVYDSGSNAGVTGSLLWDSLNDVWIYANPSGSNYASARFIAGPKNTGSLGEETGLTVGHFPIATGDDHISDSLLTYQGTTLALNTNKFTVDSESGDTLINGNFTINGTGASDNGTYSSYIVFRNDENVLGFVDVSDTGNVTDRLLGYNESTGVLEFSSLIDGGTY